MQNDECRMQNEEGAVIGFDFAGNFLFAFIILHSSFRISSTCLA